MPVYEGCWQGSCGNLCIKFKRHQVRSDDVDTWHLVDQRLAALPMAGLRIEVQGKPIIRWRIGDAVCQRQPFHGVQIWAGECPAFYFALCRYRDGTRDHIAATFA